MNQFVWGFKTRDEVYDAIAAAEQAALDKRPRPRPGLDGPGETNGQALDWDWERVPRSTTSVRSIADPEDAGRRPRLRHGSRGVQRPLRRSDRARPARGRAGADGLRCIGSTLPRS